MATDKYLIYVSDSSIAKRELQAQGMIIEKVSSASNGAMFEVVSTDTQVKALQKLKPSWIKKIKKDYPIFLC